MHIRPYVILGTATVCAGATLAVIVTTVDPYQAPTLLVDIFWLSLALVIWGLVSTLISATGQRLAVALGIGFCWMVGGVVWVGMARRGMATVRLSWGILGGTILLSLIVWIRSRISAKQPSKI